MSLFLYTLLHPFHLPLSLICSLRCVHIFSSFFSLFFLFFFFFDIFFFFFSRSYSTSARSRWLIFCHPLKPAQIFTSIFLSFIDIFELSNNNGLEWWCCFNRCLSRLTSNVFTLIGWLKCVYRGWINLHKLIKCFRFIGF